MAAHEAAIRRRDRRSLMALTGPAYFWLAATVFLPLAAMVYFSFLTEAPLAGKVGVFTLENYRAIWEKEFYGTLLWRSLGLGFHVTVLCVVIGFPAALILAKAVKGRWQAALLILVILPFWSNALVRIFSWAMVLRGNGVLETAVGWVA
ncbi:MAG: ABC transporter permease, partial [Pseudomonadota bacterium]